jgi:hypothetical protein
MADRMADLLPLGAGVLGDYMRAVVALVVDPDSKPDQVLDQQLVEVGLVAEHNPVHHHRHLRRQRLQQC